MAEVLALIKDYALPVVGCFRVATTAHGRDGSFGLWYRLFLSYHRCGAVLSVLSHAV